MFNIQLHSNRINTIMSSRYVFQQNIKICYLEDAMIVDPNTSVPCATEDLFNLSGRIVWVRNLRLM